jgi:hypothetical protein
LGRRCQLGSSVSALGVDGADQIRVKEEVRGCDTRWDPAMQHLTRSGVDALRDGGADQIGIKVDDADRIDDDEEDLRSGSIE